MRLKKATKNTKKQAAHGSCSAWSLSKQEEVIAALWLIAAFCALDAGCPKWVFVPLFVKAGLDLVCSVRAIRADKPNSQAGARGNNPTES